MKLDKKIKVRRLLKSFVSISRFDLLMDHILQKIQKIKIKKTYKKHYYIKPTPPTHYTLI